MNNIKVSDQFFWNTQKNNCFQNIAMNKDKKKMATKGKKFIKT